LKKVLIVKSTEVEVKPFEIQDFAHDIQMRSRMKKITKKELKHLADTLGLSYDEKCIGLSKKLLNAYIENKVR